MCGRFTLTSLPERFLEEFGLTDHTQGRFNIAPSQDVPVLYCPPLPEAAEAGASAVAAEVGTTADAAEPLGFRLTDMRWGLVQHGESPAKVKPINARSESVDRSPMFRDAFRHRRCLVPASGFYEWQHAAGSRARIPYYFTPRSPQQPLIFAGVWEPGFHAGGKGSGGGGSFSILTTRANDLIAPLHDRMPVIIKPPDWRRWLDLSRSRADLADLFEPVAPDYLDALRVSTYVNNPRHEGEECITPEPDDTLFGD